MAKFVQIEVTLSKRAIKLIDELPLLMQRKYAIAGCKAAAKVVQAEVRRRLPSSAKTGTRDKWSKTTAAHRSTLPPSKKAVHVYTAKEGKGKQIWAKVWTPILAFLEFGHPMKFWGKDSGRTSRPTPILRPAIDATKRQQQTAMIKAIAKGLREETRSFK